MKRIAAAIVLVMGLSAAAHAEAPAVNLDLLKIALDMVPSITESRKQAKALIAIGRAYEQAGERAEAISVLQQASTSVAQITNESLHSYYREEIIKAQREVGDFSGALKNVASIDSIRFRVFVLQHIASAQAAAGDLAGSKSTFQQAVNSASTYESAEWRASMLADITVAQVDSGDLQAAAETLELAMAGAFATDGAPPSSYALAEIAAAQSKLGDRSAATETLERAVAAAEAKRNSDDCCYALTEIARVQSLIGNQPAAKETLLLARGEAQEIVDYFDRGLQFAYIADGLRVAGARAESAATFELARTTAILIDDTKKRDLRLQMIAAVQAGLQLENEPEAFDDAMRIALASLDGRTGATGSETGFQRPTSAEDLDSAIATATQISEPLQRFDTVLAIAAPSLAMGDMDSLHKLIAEAMKCVEALEARRAGSSYMPLHDLALLYIAAGAFEWPLYAGKTLAAAPPAYMLAYVAWAQAEMGDLDAARSTLAEIPGNTDPPDTLYPDLFPRLLALAQANAGEMNAAMATVAAVGDLSRKVELLVAIAVDRPPPTFWAQITADGRDYP